MTVRGGNKERGRRRYGTKRQNAQYFLQCTQLRLSDFFNQKHILQKKK